MIERASTQWLGQQSNPPRSKCRIKPWDVLDEELGGERKWCTQCSRKNWDVWAGLLWRVAGLQQQHVETQRVRGTK